MSDTWQSLPLSEYLFQAFAGEWGSNPDPMNCVVYRSTDIDDVGNITGNGAERKLPLVKILQKQLVEGDILLEASGGGPDKPVGRSAIVDGVRASSPSTCSNFFRVLRPNTQKIDPKFLNHKLVWRYRQPEMLFFQQQTTGIINLKIKDFLATPLSVPASKEVQSKIAEVLDTLDAAIRGTEAVVAKLKAMKQGLLHDLLTRGIDANGDLRPPQSEAPHLYEQTPLGWLPKEWDALKIEEVGDVLTGKTPPAEDPAAWGDETPFVTPGDVIHSIAIGRSERHLSKRGRKYVPKVPAGATLVVCIGSTIGKVGYVQEESGFNQQINAVVPNSNHEAAFIFSSICLSIYQLHRLAGLQAVPIVNKGEFQKIQIPTAPKVEQSGIIVRLLQLEKREALEVTELQKLRATKSGLMDDLLTGRVPVTPLL